ncbi:MAG: ABC transporter permease [Chloroflexota bacterium]
MLDDTWQLMRLYWKIDWREGSGQSGWRFLAFLAGIVVMVVIGAGSAAAGYGASFLTRLDPPNTLAPGIMPGLILTFVMISVLVTGLNQAVKALFLSGDLDRLMVAPINTRSIMIAKLLSRLPSNIILLLLIAAPALIAYGIGIGAGPVYYLLGALLLLTAPLFGLAVGALLAMLLVRVLPVNRLNEMLAAAYAVMGIGFALLFQLPRFMVGNDVYESVTVDTFGTLFATLERVPLPTFWAGQGLMALNQGVFDQTGLLGIGLYLLITVGFFAVLILTADRLYLSGWLKSQSAGAKRRGLDQGGHFLGQGSLAATIGWKDWLLRVRDPRQLVNLLGSGVIAIVIGALAIFRGGTTGDASLLDAVSQGQMNATGGFGFITAGFSPGFIMAGWALFIGFMILSNTASYALALEGQSFATLKAAPVRPREVWSAKVWSVFVPYMAIFSVVLVGTRFLVNYDWRWLPYALAVGAIIGTGLIAANVSAGFRFANLTWSDPRRMLTSSGGFVAFGLTILYSLPAGLLGFLPFGLAHAWPAWTLVFVSIGLLLLGVSTWLWNHVMRLWAEKSWSKLPA